MNEGGKDLIILYLIVRYTEIINIKKGDLSLFILVVRPSSGGWVFYRTLLFFYVWLFLYIL